MQANHLTDHAPHDPAFAIQFTAIAGRELQPLCLAYAIARSKEKYGADWGRRELRLIKVHCEFSATVVFGVMFFDVLLGEAFDDAVKRSLDRDDDLFIPHGDYPVPLWNATADDFAGGLKHLHCETYLARTRYSIVNHSLRAVLTYHCPSGEGSTRRPLIVFNHYMRFRLLRNTRGKALHLHVFHWVDPRLLSTEHVQGLVHINTLLFFGYETSALISSAWQVLKRYGPGK